MLTLQKTLHSKYMELLTDAIKGVQGSPDLEIQNWVAGARRLSDSIAIMMSLACLEAILNSKAQVEEPEITTPVDEIEVSQTRGVRNGNCDLSLAAESIIGSQPIRDEQGNPVLGLEAVEINSIQENGSEEISPTGSVDSEAPALVPALGSGEGASSHGATPSRAIPYVRPFIHHTRTPRPTPQGLRREYAFNHKSHFEVAWVPEFGDVVPRTVEEALPEHYFQEAPDPVGSSQASTSTSAPTISSSEVRGDRGEENDNGGGPPLEHYQSEIDNAGTEPPASDPSQEGSSQLRRDRAMAPEPEPAPSSSKAQKRKRDEEEIIEDSESCSTRRTKSKFSIA